MTKTTDRNSLIGLIATLIVTNAAVALTVLQYSLLG